MTELEACADSAIRSFRCDVFTFQDYVPRWNFLGASAAATPYGELAHAQLHFKPRI